MDRIPPDTICYSSLKSRGWSDSLIQKLLPEPCKRPNPYYRSAAPMRLWPEAVVLEIEKSVIFQCHKKTHDKLSRSLKKTNEKKRQKLREWAETIPIKIPLIFADDLRKRTVEDKQRWHDYLAIERGVVKDPACNADDLTIARWQVNYLRHHHASNYERDLELLYGQVGKDQAYHILKKRILTKIADVYPRLAGECQRQIQSDESVSYEKFIQDWSLKSTPMLDVQPLLFD